MANKRNIPCDICGGSGEVSSFQGVSRFLLTMEECPECHGLGVRSASDSAATASHPGEEKQRGKHTGKEKK